MKRLFFGVATLALIAACGGGDNKPTPDAGPSEFDCAGATAVTTTKLQADILQPRCVSCHNGSDPVAYPGDYSTAAKAQEVVGKVSPYATTQGSTLKVVDPNNLQNSSLYLKVLGGGAAHKGPKGEGVGGAMPQGSNPLSATELGEIKNWICTGAVQQ